MASRLSDTLVEDGRLLDRKFTAADEVIDIGELNYGDFSSPLTRKVIYLQRLLAVESRQKRYDEPKVDGFLLRTRRFLGALKSGALTEKECSLLNKDIKVAYPKLVVPKSSR